jgi:uncharacterized protein YycO
MINTLKLKVIEWMMKTKIYKHVLMKIIPYIRFSLYYTDMTGVKYNALNKAMQPGDILLCIDKKKLTTKLIPGEFSHAAMCVSNDGVWETSEMTHNDYSKTCMFDICKESDRVVILRPGLPLSVINKAIEKCKTYQDVDYDIEFSLGVEALYCSELVYESYANNVLGVDITDFAGLGKPYISPTGLYNAKNVTVIIDSDKL